MSQTASVRRERVVSRTRRPRVDDNIFDDLNHRRSQPYGSTYHSRLSQASTSRSHESLDDEATSYAPEAQEEPVIDSPLKSYP